MRVGFARNLLVSWQHRFDAPEVDQHRAGIVTLLHDARHEIALFGREFDKGTVVLGLAQPLHQHSTSCRHGDSPEVIRGHVDLADDFLVVVVLGHHDPHLAGHPVKIDAGRRGCGRCRRGVAAGGTGTYRDLVTDRSVVRRQQRFFDRGHHAVE